MTPQDTPPARPRSTLAVVVAALLFVVQACADLVTLGVLALASGSTAHEMTAVVLLGVVLVADVAVLVLSIRFADRDRSTGRRSPVTWAVLGLGASIGLGLLAFSTLLALGPALHGQATVAILVR